MGLPAPDLSDLSDGLPPGDPDPLTATLALGLLTLGATLLVSSGHLLVVGALGGPVLVLPVLGTASVALGLGVRRGGRGWVVGALVFGVLITLGNLGHMADTLALPDSAWDFVPNLVAAVCLVVVLAAAVARLAGATSSAAAQRRLRLGAGAIALVGAVASVTLTVTGDRAPLPSTDGLPVVETVANAYQPGRLAVAAGDALVLRNVDAYGHTFTVEELDLDVPLAGNRETVVTVPTSATVGAYRILCVLHPGIMEGTLEVGGGA